MQQLILVLHVLVAVCIVSLVLVQHGKGADVGAAFGSGASNTMFGSQGSTSFLVKVTAGLVAVFFATSLTLGYMSAHHVKKHTFLNLPEKAVVKTPVSSVKTGNQAKDSVRSTPANEENFTPTVPAKK
jgi:preprotein translocase subunit SecG